MQQSALTLKQTLASCACVATLTTVLVPVFRESVPAGQGIVVNKYREAAKGMLLYSEAHDGILPFAYGWRYSNSTWMWNNLVPAPSGWHTLWQGEERQRNEAMHYINSVTPYWDDPETMAEMPSLRETGASPQEVATAVVPPYKSTLTFNGYLHSWQVAASPDPEIVPLMWNGYGNRNKVGWSYANPVMNCSQRPASPCTFRSDANDPKAPSAWLWDGGTADVISGHFFMVNLDMSITRVSPASNPEPQFSGVDPFAEYRNETPETMWGTYDAVDNTFYMAVFSPLRSNEGQGFARLQNLVKIRPIEVMK